MNNQLTESIIRHILSNFLIIPSVHINVEKTQSLMDKKFLLKDSIKIELENGSFIKNDIHGCQLSTGEQEIKILVSNCSSDVNIPEFCLVVQLKNAPMYAIYLVYNDLDDQVTSDPMMACSLDGKSWMPCTTYLQATFLAGMEQIKELGLNWSLCENYKNQFDGLISFLNYYNDFYEVEYARQEG